MSQSGQSRPKDAGILIINSVPSAEGILKVIHSYQRIFARHPIRILRGDVQADSQMIRAFMTKLNIKAAPCLIASNNTIVVGNREICDFLPKLAHAINTIEANGSAMSPACHVSADEEGFREHQLRESMRMDQAGAEGDDADDQGSISARMEWYRREMGKRQAVVLQEDSKEALAAGRGRGRGAPGPPRGPPPGRFADPPGPKESLSIPDVDDDDEPPPEPRPVGRGRASIAPRSQPRQGAMPPPAMPAQHKGGGGDGDDPFARRFQEMFEETAMPPSFQQ